MENEMNEQPEETGGLPENRGRDTLLQLVCAEVLCVVLLLAGLTAVKLFAPACFRQSKKWYKAHFLTETSVSEVLGSADDSSAGSSENTAEKASLPEKAADGSDSSAGADSSAGSGVSAAESTAKPAGGGTPSESGNGDAV